MPFIVTLSQGVVINTTASVLLDDPMCFVNHSLGRCGTLEHRRNEGTFDLFGSDSYTAYRERLLSICIIWAPSNRKAGRQYTGKNGIISQIFTDVKLRIVDETPCLLVDR